MSPAVVAATLVIRTPPGDPDSIEVVASVAGQTVTDVFPNTPEGVKQVVRALHNMADRFDLQWCAGLAARVAQEARETPGCPDS